MQDTCQSIIERRPLRPGFGFDDVGEVVPIAEPAHDLGDVCPHCSRSYHEEGTGQDVAEIREQAIREVLDFLTAGEVEVNRIGWRCSLTAWLVNRQQESQRELAARLGVTEGRISQSLKSARDEIARFIRAKQGQAFSGAKVRPHRYER